jgi:hypothetical protein
MGSPEPRVNREGTQVENLCYEGPELEGTQVNNLCYEEPDLQGTQVENLCYEGPRATRRSPRPYGRSAS